MNSFFIIAFCFLPLAVLFIINIFFIKVSAGKLLLSAFLGLVAVLPIVFVQFFISDLNIFNERSFTSELLRAIILNGFIEELWKSAVLFVLPARKMTLKEFFICAIIAGLSLGCFESAVYFLRYLQMARESGAALLYAQILMRMFSADLIHLFCTGLGGIFVWAVRNRKQAIAALIFAIVAHGLYNFFSLYTTGIRFFSIAAILFAALECRIRFANLQNKINIG